MRMWRVRVRGDEGGNEMDSRVSGFVSYLAVIVRVSVLCYVDVDVDDDDGVYLMIRVFHLRGNVLSVVDDDDGCGNYYTLPWILPLY